MQKLMLMILILILLLISGVATMAGKIMSKLMIMSMRGS